MHSYCNTIRNKDSHIKVTGLHKNTPLDSETMVQIIHFLYTICVPSTDKKEHSIHSTHCGRSTV